MAEEKERRNVLISGASGFIGSNLLEYLYRKYPAYTFVNLDALTYCGNELNVSEDIRNDHARYAFVRGNVVDRELIKWILVKHKIDTILHLAAESSVDYSFVNSLKFSETNIIGTHQLLQAIYEVFHVDGVQKGFPGLKTCIFVSSDEVYGSDMKNDAANPYVEHESLLLPTSPYSASKAAAEMLVQASTAVVVCAATLCFSFLFRGTSRALDCRRSCYV